MILSVCAGEALGLHHRMALSGEEISKANEDQLAKIIKEVDVYKVLARE